MLPTKLHAMQSLVRTIFNKEDEDIRKYDKNRYLALLNSEKFHRIFDRIRYLIRLKHNISSIYSHKIRIKIDSDDDLPLEKTISMHYALILFRSVFNENHNHYYYKVFLEKYLCK